MLFQCAAKLYACGPAKASSAVRVSSPLVSRSLPIQPTGQMLCELKWRTYEIRSHPHYSFEIFVTKSSFKACWSALALFSVA